MYNEKISAAAKVSKSDPGTCKPVDPKSSEIISKDGGLDLNDFICYDYDLIQQEYLTCPPTPEVPGLETKASDGGSGAGRASRILSLAAVSAGAYMLSSA